MCLQCIWRGPSDVQKHQACRRAKVGGNLAVIGNDARLAPATVRTVDALRRHGERICGDESLTDHRISRGEADVCLSVEECFTEKLVSRVRLFARSRLRARCNARAESRLRCAHLTVSALERGDRQPLPLMKHEAALGPACGKGKAGRSSTFCATCRSHAEGVAPLRRRQ
jgi:hypothetical protein